MNEQQNGEPGPEHPDPAAQQVPPTPPTAPGQIATPAQPDLGAPATYYQQPANNYQPQPPKKRGLPVGAWIGIAIGGVVLLGIISLVIALIVWLVLIPKPTPVPETEPVPPVEVPGEDDAPLPTDEVISLDAPSNFTSGPFWAVTYAADWDIVQFDVEGINEFSHAPTGCQFLSYQGYGDPNVTASDDRTATEDTIPTALQIGIPWDFTVEPEVLVDGSVDVPVDYAYAVEMLKLRADYTSSDGDRTRQIVMRTFMPDDIALYAEVDCPSSAEAEDAAQQMLDGLAITEY